MEKAAVVSSTRNEDVIWARPNSETKRMSFEMRITICYIRILSRISILLDSVPLVYKIKFSFKQYQLTWQSSEIAFHFMYHSALCFLVLPLSSFSWRVCTVGLNWLLVSFWSHVNKSIIIIIIIIHSFIHVCLFPLQVVDYLTVWLLILDCMHKIMNSDSERQFFNTLLQKLTKNLISQERVSTRLAAHEMCDLGTAVNQTRTASTHTHSRHTRWTAT